VGTVSLKRHEAAGVLVPQRVSYVPAGMERREFEFDRRQDAKLLVDEI